MNLRNACEEPPPGLEMRAFYSGIDIFYENTLGLDRFHTIVQRWRGWCWWESLRWLRVTTQNTQIFVITQLENSGQQTPIWLRRSF